MRLFAIFKNEEFLGTVKNSNGSSLKNWASEFYKVNLSDVKVYELVEVN